VTKTVTFFLVMLIGCSILGAIMQGGGGIVTTELTSDITAEDLTVPVTSTTDYLGADYVIIGGEKILYTGKTAVSFTGCTRGYGNTEASAHPSGALVYTADAGAINNALGFNVAATIDSMGVIAFVAIPIQFFVITVPRIVRVNMTFLSGGLAIIGWMWLAMCAGFIITLAMSIIGARRV